MDKPYYAFFDVDGTLIRIKSMFSFQSFYYRRVNAKLGAQRSRAFKRRIHALGRSGVDRAVINARFYESFRGRSAATVKTVAREWYDWVRRTAPHFFLDEALAELRLHRARGAGVVFVSGSFQEVLAPLASELEADEVLATSLEVVRGRYTGRIVPPQVIGAGKAQVVRAFLRDRRVEPNGCYAYGDHGSDLPMLDIVGYPVVVGADAHLVSRAHRDGWRVLGAA